MSDAPQGTVTLVFTDVQGSTLLWDLYPEGMHDALKIHNDVLRAVLLKVGGYEVRTEGDAFVLAFQTPQQAVCWCLEAQQALLEANWPQQILQSIEAGEVHDAHMNASFRGLRVRMGIHCGEPEIRQIPVTGRTDYVGGMVHRAVGISDAGHGGQILMSAAVHKKLSDDDDWVVVDLGEHRIKWMDAPEHLYQVSSNRLSHRPFPPIRTQEAQRTNLPHYETPFINRTLSLQALEDYFDHAHRVITLLGPGGMGKSRLAVHYGSLHRMSYEGGVWFCDLSEAVDLKDVLLTVSTVLSIPMARVHSSEEMQEQLGYAIAGRGSILLLLDNFEHVVHAAHQAISHWMLKAPSAHFMITSRNRLGVKGERVYHLSPLNEDHSVALFTACAQSHYQANPMPEADIPWVKKIVNQLEGIPLGIELVAGQMKNFLLEELLENLQSKMDVLPKSDNDDEEKKTTLRATIDWSWGLLEPWEQFALMQCAVFCNGFYLESAEEMISLDDFDDAPWILDVIETLHDKSLLHTWDAPEFPDEIRFGMYESVRIYALEKLASAGQENNLRQKHAQYFLLHGETWRHGLSTQEGVSCLNRLALERDNLVNAYEQFVSASPDKAVRMILLMHPFFLIRSPSEYYASLLDQAVTLSSKSMPELHAQALKARGEMFYNRGLIDAAEQDLTSSRERFKELGDVQGEGEAVLLLGNAVHRAQRKRSLAYWREAEEIATQANDEPTQAQAMAQIGRITKDVPLMERAIAFFEASGDRYGEENWRMALGTLHLEENRFDQAQDCYTQALLMARMIRDNRLEGIILGSLGIIQAEKGKFQASEHLYQEAMTKLEEIGAKSAASVFLGNLGTLYFHHGDFEKARQTYEAAFVIFEDMNDQLNLAYFKAFYAGLLAEEQKIVEAQDFIDFAKMTLKEIGDDLGVVAVSVCSGLIDLAHARQAMEAGHASEARDHIKAVCACMDKVQQKGPSTERFPQGTPSLAEQSGDVRDGLRFLSASMKRYEKKFLIESA